MLVWQLIILFEKRTSKTCYNVRNSVFHNRIFAKRSKLFFH